MAFKTDEPNQDLFGSAKKDVRRKITPLIDEVSALVDELKAKEEEVAEVKEQIRELAKLRYWDLNFNKKKPQHTFDANGRNNVAQLNFLNKYDLDKKKIQELMKLLGNKSPVAKYFKENTVVTIDVTKLSQKDQREFFVAAKALCDEHGLAGFVDDKYTVDKEFHDARHELIPAVNQAIDEVLPVQVHITT